jgi:hypothetical protein
MPAVPKYKGGNATPSGRLPDAGSAAAFGGVRSAQIGKMADSYLAFRSSQIDLETEEKEKIADAKATEAANNYSLEMSKLGSEFNTLEGSSAVDGLTPFQDKTNDLYTQFQDGLSSQREKDLFVQKADSVRFGSLRQAVSHSAKQGKVFSDQTKLGEIYAATQRAVTDLTQTEDAISNIHRVTASMNPGASEAVIGMESAKNVSNLISAQVESITAKEGAGKAYAYFSVAKKYLPADIAAGYEGGYKKAAQIHEALETAAKLAGNPRMTYEQATKIAEQEKDPEQRARLLNNIGAEFSRRAQREQAAAATAKNSLVQKALDGTLKRSEILQAMESGVLAPKDMEKFLQDVEDTKAGVMVAVNYDKYEELAAMSNEELMGADLSKYLRYLPPDVLEEFRAAQADLLRTGATGASGVVPAGMAVKAGRVALQGDSYMTPKAFSGSPSKAQKEANQETANRRARYLMILEAEFRKLPKSERTTEKAQEIAKTLLAPSGIREYSSFMGVEVPGTSRVKRKFETMTSY